MVVGAKPLTRDIRTRRLECLFGRRAGRMCASEGHLSFRSSTNAFLLYARSSILLVSPSHLLRNNDPYSGADHAPLHMAVYSAYTRQCFLLRNSLIRQSSCVSMTG